MTFRRTAATDFELGGQTILAGEKVVMFYSSGNWDSEAFDHPDQFDLSRSPNPHLGFGGGGVHFCLGAHVARAQLRAIFAELLRQLPNIEAGDPTYVAGNFVHAVRQPALHLLTQSRCGALDNSLASSTNNSEQPPSTLTEPAHHRGWGRG